ncbi:MAG: hypothetical protein RI519_07585 [Balneolaceae bacterium]|nr:hypothetical protein [Balneolaceae bacterium]
MVNQLWRYLGDFPHDTPGYNDMINDATFKTGVRLVCLDCGQSCFEDDAQRDRFRSSPCLRGRPYSETVELGDSEVATPSTEVEELVEKLVDSLDYTYDEPLAKVEELHSYHLPLDEIERALRFQDELR